MSQCISERSVSCGIADRSTVAVSYARTSDFFTYKSRCSSCIPGGLCTCPTHRNSSCCMLQNEYMPRCKGLQAVCAHKTLCCRQPCAGSLPLSKGHQARARPMLGSKLSRPYLPTHQAMPRAWILVLDKWMICPTVQTHRPTPVSAQS